MRTVSGQHPQIIISLASDRHDATGIPKPVSSSDANRLNPEPVDDHLTGRTRSVYRRSMMVT
ncbi:MAG: hypothetical protein KDB86_07815, partial [Actinobacteria bacterium]|nr:hypothetical protein [Actinomycetota bacterium]